MKTRSIFLTLVLLCIGGGIVYLESGKSRNTSSTVSPKEVRPPAMVGTANRTKIIQEKAGQFERAKEITTPDGFINTDKISIGGLVGKKIILVDFWTYSCINCQRTTPYLNAWYQKYRDKGLEIIGVHTPEFDFEKIYDNVLAATKKFNITYPVVLDNDFSTWQAYKNQYWPRKYLIDIDGFIVYDHIGEGGYSETEKKIQELLEERTTVLGMNDAIPKDIANPTDAISVGGGGQLSPEIYFGSSRNEFLANGVPGAAGPQTFTVLRSVEPEKLYLEGEWNITPEYAENKTGAAKIIFTYRGKDLYMVAGSEKSLPIYIIRDGMPIGGWMGSDLTSDGGESFVNVKEEKLYKLIEDSTYGTHTIEITIPEGGLRAFTFTFG